VIASPARTFASQAAALNFHSIADILPLLCANWWDVHCSPVLRGRVAAGSLNTRTSPGGLPRWTSRRAAQPEDPHVRGRRPDRWLPNPAAPAPARSVVQIPSLTRARSTCRCGGRTSLSPMTLTLPESPVAMISGRVASLFRCRRTSYDAARHETPRRTP
jgi:hypothetical protein